MYITKYKVIIGVATSPTGPANARPTFSNYLTNKDNYSENDKINTFGSYLACNLWHTTPQYHTFVCSIVVDLLANTLQLMKNIRPSSTNKSY